MSLNRMTKAERARYLIGEAIMRRIAKTETDLESNQEILALFAWFPRWLSQAEFDDLNESTDYALMNLYGLQGDDTPPNDPPNEPDDVPF
jgi:hypothetical protein